MDLDMYSNLQGLVDALQFGHVGMQAKPDHLGFVVIQLQLARRAPLCTLETQLVRRSRTDSASMSGLLS